MLLTVYTPYSSDDLCPSFLSSLGDVVVVVPNYRLGVLGFLYDGTDEAPGNAGLYDQLLALEWTRQHIDSFGGNGSNIVLMGHGSGATSIGYYLFSMASNKSSWTGPVLSRAILMSDSPFTRSVLRQDRTDVQNVQTYRTDRTDPAVLK